MNTSRPRLDRVDLSSIDTLAALVKLLVLHVPYSLHVLGSIINTVPRTSTLQGVDASKVFLWSTIAIPNTNPPALFSVVAFSHLNQQFSIFCSSDSSTSTDPPSEAERTHVKHVFECIQELAHDARPGTYDSVLTPRGATKITDTSMVVVGAVHTKWAEALAPMSACQSLNVRHVFPRGGTPLEQGERQRVEMEMEVSEIRASDLSFVHGASSVPRSDAYLLSRAPYSVCLRLRGDAGMGMDGRLGPPVACVLLHADGSIGALRVDSKHQRRGLGRLVVRMLVEKLDFTKDQSDVVSDDHQDLGGGAFGWNWMDTGPQNEAGNRFLSSMVGKENSWPCHWTYIPVDGTLPLKAHYSFAPDDDYHYPNRPITTNE